MKPRLPCPHCKNPIGTEGCALNKTKKKITITEAADRVIAKSATVPNAPNKNYSDYLNEAALLDRMREKGYSV